MTASLPPCKNEPPALSQRAYEEQKTLRVRAGLMDQLQQHIASQGWGDEDVMRHFSLDHNRLHYWKKGPKHFSVNGLLSIFTRLNLSVSPSTS